MICRKCESRINSGTKCFNCGHDTNSPAPASAALTKKRKRGPILIAVMSLFIIIDIMKILVNIGGIVGNLALVKLLSNFYLVIDQTVVYMPNVIPYKIRAGIQIAVILFNISLLCICIVKLKKWAFKVYIGLTVLAVVTKIIWLVSTFASIPEVSVIATIRVAITPFILKGLLLFVVYITDGKNFGGISFNESVSAIRARKRREREELKNN